MGEQPRAHLRTDQSHPLDELARVVRCREPDYGQISIQLEQFPLASSAIFVQANLLRSGPYRRPIHDLEHALVFLGIDRVRQVLSGALAIEPQRLHPPE